MMYIVSVASVVDPYPVGSGLFLLGPIRIRKNRSGSETGSDLYDKKICMILEFFHFKIVQFVFVNYFILYLHIYKEKPQNAWNPVTVTLCKSKICQLLVTRHSLRVGAGIRNRIRIDLESRILIQIKSFQIPNTENCCPELP